MSLDTSARAGLLAGLGNQTCREGASWWITGRWRRQALIWTVLLSGLFVLMRWALPALVPDEAGVPAAGLD